MRHPSTFERARLWWMWHRPSVIAALVLVTLLCVAALAAHQAGRKHSADAGEGTVLAIGVTESEMGTAPIVTIQLADRRVARSVPPGTDCQVGDTITLGGPGHATRCHRPNAPR